MELVSAAYEEALRQHGMLNSTVGVIHAKAWANLTRALLADVGSIGPGDDRAAP